MFLCSGELNIQTNWDQGVSDNTFVQIIDICIKLPNLTLS